MSSRKQLIQAGISKCQWATDRALKHKTSSDPEVRELAEAVHYLSWGVQEIALALTEDGYVDDLPGQQQRPY